MVGYDNKVDELGINGYINLRRKFVNVFDSDDDDEEMKRDFLMKNEDYINHEAVLKVLGV